MELSPLKMGILWNFQIITCFIFSCSRITSASAWSGCTCGPWRYGTSARWLRFVSCDPSRCLKANGSPTGPNQLHSANMGKPPWSFILAASCCEPTFDPSAIATSKFPTCGQLFSLGDSQHLSGQHLSPSASQPPGTSTCMASCIADAFYNARCNGIVGCDPEEVVVDSGRRTADRGVGMALGWRPVRRRKGLKPTAEWGFNMTGIEMGIYYSSNLFFNRI